MQYYSPLDYLKIVIGSQFGLDKELFSTRIDWVNKNFIQLEYLSKKADEPYMYLAAVKALRDTLNGVATGFLAGLDATASGISILGVLTGCVDSLRITNLIDPTVRYDAYTEGMKEMNNRLSPDNQIGFDFDLNRNDVKQAIMTHYYGSFEQPMLHLGEGSPAYNAFYPAMGKLAPGPTDAMYTLLDIRDPDATVNMWTLPDRHTAYVPVMVTEDKKIEVEELGGATCTHRMKVNKAKETDVSLVANVTHSIDGFIVREMNERCNYDPVELSCALLSINKLLTIDARATNTNHDNRYLFVSLASVSWLDELSVNDLRTLKKLIDKTLMYKSFQLICVHDEFKSHVNNTHTMRTLYLDIMIELADSVLLQSILREITGNESGTYTKLDNNVSALMRDAEYHLC
jgi:hypothetical protein